MLLQLLLLQGEHGGVRLHVGGRGIKAALGVERAALRRGIDGVSLVGIGHGRWIRHREWMRDGSRVGDLGGWSVRAEMKREVSHMWGAR
jgi:hypothetical protein